MLIPANTVSTSAYWFTLRPTMTNITPTAASINTGSHAWPVFGRTVVLLTTVDPFGLGVMEIFGVIVIFVFGVGVGVVVGVGRGLIRSSAVKGSTSG